MVPMVPWVFEIVPWDPAILKGFRMCLRGSWSTAEGSVQGVLTSSTGPHATNIYGIVIILIGI